MNFQEKLKKSLHDENFREMMDAGAHPYEVYKGNFPPEDQSESGDGEK